MDLADIVGRMAHVVLDQVPALDHRDLGDPSVAAFGGVGFGTGCGHVHRHEVPTDGPPFAFAAPALFQGVGIELDRLGVVRGLDRD
ncbi:MAG: hypothetical protein WKF43_11360 [Acidimicrobiales bacterium]